MAEPMIKLEHIKKFYGKKEVLKDVSLTVNKGDIYGLIGKNGAGKSTLFKVVLGLSEYQGGRLELMGSDKKLAESRKHIGFLIGNNAFNYMTAEQNLRYYARMKQIPDAKKEIKRVLELVELAGVKTKVGGFSLGMHQRLGIANAVLGNPDILILDEPTNGLDPQGIADVRHTIQRLNEELGMTVIVSSHILGELQNTANRFGIVNNGTIVRELTQEDLQTKDNVIRLSVDDKDRAKEILTREGIQILSEQREAKSLEEFYFSLIGGGEQNA